MITSTFKITNLYNLISFGNVTKVDDRNCGKVCAILDVTGEVWIESGPSIQLLFVQVRCSFTTVLLSLVLGVLSKGCQWELLLRLQPNFKESYLLVRAK